VAISHQLSPSSRSWFDAARVSNWLHNGAQTHGSTDSTAFAPQNTGAYELGATTSGTTFTRNSGPSNRKLRRPKTFRYRQSWKHQAVCCGAPPFFDIAIDTMIQNDA